MFEFRKICDDPEGLTKYTLNSPIYTSVKKFKFIVLPGNFPNNVKPLIRARGNWEEMTDEDDAIEYANFIWRPTNYNRAGYAKINARNEFNDFPLVFNHFEFINCISTKTGLVETLTKYYESNTEAKSIGYTVFDTTPTTFIADDDNKHSKLQK